MSSRLLLNLALGSTAILLVLSVGTVVTTRGNQDADKAQIDLAQRQQTLIQNLNQEVADLEAADNLLAVNQARSQVGRTIVQIDQNLSALIRGGEVENLNGLKVAIGKVENKNARKALKEGARIWVETGMPLADLAAGEFSIFSSAGREAVAGLTRNSPALANQMSIAATACQMKTNTQTSRAGFARYAVMGFGVLFGALALARFRPARPAAPAPPVSIPPSQPMNPPVMENSTEAKTARAPVPSLQPEHRPGGVFNPPVDFDSVNATVDQMSVDMNTIAGSTDKMRLAIDSVGHALQGMLYSLNEMAQDTSEGYKIVRGANNAASYTASTAGDLATAAREMSQVVARVTQLATKTKQVAAQIDAEAVSTGSTGEAFTSVVAAEVKGLARQTSSATQEIENTVAEILGTARHYEEAIGQIIKNIGAINKVSQSLGELMLQPPAKGVAGSPLTLAQALPLDPGSQVAAPAPDPLPVAETPEAAAEPSAVVEPEETWIEESTAEEVAAETSAAIEETAEEISPSDQSQKDDGGSNVFMLNKHNKTVAEKPVETEPEVEEPAAPEPDPEPAAAQEEPVAVPADDDTPAGDSGSNSNIFMLNKPKK